MYTEIPRNAIATTQRSRHNTTRGGLVDGRRSYAVVIIRPVDGRLRSRGRFENGLIPMDGAELDGNRRKR